MPSLLTMIGILMLAQVAPVPGREAGSAPANAARVDETSSAPARPRIDPATPAVRSAEIQSVFDFVQRGGILMFPIGLCSLIAVTVIVERLASLRRRRIIPPAFEPGLRRLLDQGLHRRGEAIEYCRRDDSPVAHVFATAVKRLGEPIELLERHVQEAGEREVFKLRKYLRILAVIAAISPLLGLLGTIFGMIKAFQTVAVSADALGKTEMLASGIYEALITTAAGLVVAIPALIAFHWLSSRVESIVADLDRMTLAFIEEYVLPGGPKTPPASLEMRSVARTPGQDNGRKTVESGALEPESVKVEVV